MSGFCYRCSSSFGLLNKEKSCKLCHYAVCSKCIIKQPTGEKICSACAAAQATVPAPGDSEKKGESSVPPREPIEMPENFLKRQQADAAAGRRSPVSSSQPVPAQQQAAKDDKDSITAMERRLRLLNSNSSQEEVLTRKFEEVTGKKAISEKPPIQLYIPPRSEQSQADDLVAQLVEENRIGLSGNKVDDQHINRRLSILKEFTKDLPPGEIKISDITRAVDAKTDADEKEKELPWCVLCNEDASLRCHGCEEDLYCKRCYKEFHSPSDDGPHDTSPFKGPSNFET